MKYRHPSDDDAAEYLTDAELAVCRTPSQVVARGRAKAWAEYKASGPSARLRNLACGSLGDSVVLEGYRTSNQISSLCAQVSAEEGVQFTTRIERSLVDGSVIGVRVTLAAFTR